MVHFNGAERTLHAGTGERPGGRRIRLFVCHHRPAVRAGTYGCWRRVKKIRRQIQNHKELAEQDAALAQQEADEQILQEARRKQAVKEQYLENLRRKCAADSKTAAPAANPDTQKQEMEEAINSLLEDGTLKGMNQSAAADVPSVQKQ
jgi:uncharacterized protein HemY